MRGLRGLAVIAAVCAAAPAMAAQLTPSPTQLVAIEERQRKTKPARKKVNLGLADSAPRWKRSRGMQAKPKKRPNMRHVAKRVRRKHRRARAA